MPTTTSPNPHRNPGRGPKAAARARAARCLVCGGEGTTKVRYHGLIVHLCANHAVPIARFANTLKFLLTIFGG